MLGSQPSKYSSPKPSPKGSKKSLFFLIVVFGFLGVSYQTKLLGERTQKLVLKVGVWPDLRFVELTPAPQPHKIAVSDRIKSGETLYAALTRHQVSEADIHTAALALRKDVNMRGIRPGDAFLVEKLQDEINPQVFKLLSLELFKIDEYNIPVRFRLEKKPDASWYFTKHQAQVEIKQGSLSGSLESNLYEAMVEKGADPGLVDQFASIFGWQIDFYREARRNDKFRIIVEQRFVESRFIGFGKILAAEYQNADRIYKAYHFRSKDGKLVGFFNEKGESLERSFLRSPMELVRITSRYGRRFHPVLGRKKMHNGVDYGAPRGTAFFSVADGVVTEARWHRYNGNFIRIQHKGGYMTEYMHASRIAKGIRPGARVKQRQVIGYVGSTGLATGPHLHLGMKKNGFYVDPAKQKFMSASPIPVRYMSEYASNLSNLQTQLAAVINTKIENI